MKELLELRGGGPDVVGWTGSLQAVSHFEVLDDGGVRRVSARLLNELESVAGFFRSLGEPCRVVLEAGWNWRSMPGRMAMMRSRGAPRLMPTAPGCGPFLRERLPGPRRLFVR